MRIEGKKKRDKRAEWREGGREGLIKREGGGKQDRKFHVTNLKGGGISSRICKRQERKISAISF